MCTLVMSSPSIVFRTAIERLEEGNAATRLLWFRMTRCSRLRMLLALPVH